MFSSGDEVDGPLYSIYFSVYSSRSFDECFLCFGILHLLSFMSGGGVCLAHLQVNVFSNSYHTSVSVVVLEEVMVKYQFIVMILV